MSLISPLNFLFAGLGGVILLLYLLRLKRKERQVPSTLLWESALRDLQANAPWQKLRSSLLMALQLGFLALLVLALVRPVRIMLAAGGQTTAIILDTSGSMNATDIAPSRLGNATQKATALINGLASHDSATLITAGQETRVLAPLTNDKNALKRALGKVTTENTGCNMREAIVLAASLLHAKKNPQIYVFSDGAVEPLHDLALGPVALQFVKIGRRNNNLGIISMSARRGYSSNQRAQIFVTIANYTSTLQKINLELSHDGNLVEVRPVSLSAAGPDAHGTLQPGQKSEIFGDLPYDSGLFSARFDHADDLSEDNVAYAQLNPPRPLRVLLNSDNLFLEKALNLNPYVHLYEGNQQGDFDVVVFDGSVPPNLPDANQLVFNAETQMTPVTVVGTVSAPSVADFDREHPVSHDAPWNDIRFAQTQAVKLKPWGKAVVEAATTPLVVVGEKGGKRVVWCGFDLRDTDFPLRVAFPIFISNVLSWLTQPGNAPGSNQDAPSRTGDTVTLLPPKTLTSLVMQYPDRTQHTLKISQPGQPLLFSDTSQVGVYTATATNWQQSFAVSLLRKSESDLTVRDVLQVSDKSTLTGQNTAHVNQELWGFFVLAGLVVLVVEWWVFHRGL